MKGRREGGKLGRKKMMEEENEITCGRKEFKGRNGRKDENKAVRERQEGR